MKKVLLLFILLSSFVFGKLNQYQIKLLQTVYDEAKKYKAIDGHVFNDTLCAIYLTESSAGIDVIGDNVDLRTGKIRTLFESSIGPGQIRLATALFVMNHFPDEFKDYSYLMHDDIYAYKKYVIYLKNIDKFEDIIKRYRSKYPYIKSKKKRKRYRNVLRWANKELINNRRKLKKYKYIIYKDKQIINLLFTDPRFSAKISTFYLIYNYNYALNHKMSNPWFRAISRYNGGWVNKKYYKKVISKMKIVRKLKKQGILH